MVDQGISIFKIFNAEATYQNGSLEVKLYYPSNPEEVNKRFSGNSQFGSQVLENLLQTGHAQIATSACPIKPADGGSIYVFSDDVVLVHRRHFPLGKNSVHNFYHSAPGGYTESLNATYSKKGLVETALKETAEEQLLITRDKHPWLIVPTDTKEYTFQTVKNLELIDFFGNRIKYINTEVFPSKDKLQVYSGDGQHIFTSENEGFLDLMWDNSTSLSMMFIRRLPMKSTEVLPIDAEGMLDNQGKFIHFNRESYLLPLSELVNKKFGTPLINPQVFQTKINRNSLPLQIYHPQSTPSFYGPDEKIVSNPHLFAPENHFTVCLDALGVAGFNGKRLDWQLWKEKCTRDNASMIPQEYLLDFNQYQIIQPPTIHFEIHNK